MKNIYSILALLLFSFFFSQVPQGFTYQTIAFNASGAPIANGNVSLKISILDNSATGTVLYAETHNKTTNNKGLVNLNIGQGTAVTGTFSGINWGTNPKFVKVELDPAGGTNYTNVGVNQLMSVPYAQVSKTVVTGAGQGITLVSPNGTSYVVNVSDSGTLSLPTSTSTSTTFPTNLYMYGSYNLYNASSAELLRNSNNSKIGYKYFSANSEVKFITAKVAGAQVYGIDGSGSLVLNGSTLNIPSNGLYQISLINYGSNGISVFSTNISPSISNIYSPITQSPATYNTSTKKYSITISGVTSSNFSGFRIYLGGNNSEYLGDNLADGNFDEGGSNIMIPNLTSTPKNFRIDFNINVDATGSYTITQI